VRVLRPIAILWGKLRGGWGVPVRGEGRTGDGGREAGLCRSAVGGGTLVFQAALQPEVAALCP